MAERAGFLHRHPVERQSARRYASQFRRTQSRDTDPGVRGDTSGGGGKPATLETGAVVRVPLFIDKEELVRVDTRTGEYWGESKNSNESRVSVRRGMWKLVTRKPQLAIQTYGAPAPHSPC